MGCSTCCYCSEECQTIHWVGGNHRSECKHIQILNKYHKPYAKEIREAAVRGETHPVLEKLRNKLGLTRPTEEYQELRCEHPSTHDGEPIDPFKILVARDDGTVWIGSTPDPIGLSTGSTTNATTDDAVLMIQELVQQKMSSHNNTITDIII
mmetsp:Transcript_19969/g.20305  ORF Transcript_19969/g.20305 Transcript_19969/m.20305 type:complete len:152 (+) Transcript_19969:125-580(+)